MNANVRFRTAQPPAEPDDVQAAEAELGFPIPAQYRAFLLEHNGGELEENELPAFEGPPGVSIERFLGVPPAGTRPRVSLFADDSTLVERFLDYRDRFDRPLLPVANGYGGADLVCLSPAGEDEGSVYLWWHETEEATRLAGSLSEFLAELSYDVGEVPEASATELWFDVEANRQWVEQGIATELVPHRQPDGSLFVPIGTEMRHGRLFEGWRAILPGELDYDRWEREIEGGGR
jgi:hypothetical protein